ncbi:MAG: ADP-ribosylglycohydrolase family protein [Chlamydiales bacterium]|nr:ADP-ribosylglycohydrolase family protein [Chlamydiales bacterium]
MSTSNIQAFFSKSWNTYCPEWAIPSRAKVAGIALVFFAAYLFRSPLSSLCSFFWSPAPPTEATPDKVWKKEIPLRTFLERNATNRSSLCRVTLFKDHPLLSKARELLDVPSSSTPVESKALGCMIGNVVGDAVGAPFEFKPWKKDIEVAAYNRFRLEEGQWTDDASMMLCLADVLSLQENYDQLDGALLMTTFYHWWYYGYNNAFRNNPRESVGLGGNISAALTKINPPSGPYVTRAGNTKTSGNGSAMRNAPVALVASSPHQAMQLAWEQSRVTHQGIEAALCCMVMADLSYRMIHSEETNPTTLKAQFFERLETFTFPRLEEEQGIVDESKTSVLGLIRSEQAVTALGKTENWNWKDEGFTYHPGRLQTQPGYIGSYVMDGLAMALHCIYTTATFEEAVLKATKHGGDADTVGAITAQLAGALYGLQAIPKTWIDSIRRHDGDGEIACRALHLLERRSVNSSISASQS